MLRVHSFVIRSAGVLALSMLVMSCSMRLPWLRSRAKSTAPVIEKITSVHTRVPLPGLLPEVVGRSQSYRVQEKETLLDVARAAGLGFSELQSANRGVDEWVPPKHQEVTVPTQWIVPRSGYRGLVINIPEMRLYLFPKNTKPGQLVNVKTYAIGIGTEQTPSPAGPFRVTGKDENPTWYVPDSIYRTMEPPRRRVVPPGPDNPLGAYRMRLSKGLYSIHGTDSPWSIGRLTTHGCIRLYPEDIGELYRAVPLGASGELVYQPIKFGERDGRIYVEVHDDIYKRMGNLERTAFALARRQKLIDRIDPKQLRQAVRERRGAPIDVTRPSAGSYELVRGSASSSRPGGSR
jgi:L,D-transpeptidase ErfK/SrfK